MSFFDTPFDASVVEPSGSYTPIPEGQYEVIVTAASEAPTKSGGLQAVFSLEVIKGEYKGRKLTKRINLRNANPKCVEIGQSELSGICRASGVIKPKGWHEFAGKVLTFKVVVAPRSDTGELSNEVKGALLGKPEAPAAAKTPTTDGPAWG